jgi:hypothetical protein
MYKLQSECDGMTMENLCNNCIHKDVCSRWTATWGMKSCEHYREERKGKVVREHKANVVSIRVDGSCPLCDEPMMTSDNFCPRCGCDMRGTKDG